MSFSFTKGRNNDLILVLFSCFILLNMRPINSLKDEPDSGNNSVFNISGSCDSLITFELFNCFHNFVIRILWSLGSFSKLRTQFE